MQKIFKVMIVDDDVLARIGIKSIIPWNEYGFELVGEFENGCKALEMSRELLPDIIISDINMPLMNGVDLIRRLNEEGIPAKVIVLSSYGDFQYVKEAMKLGAEDYLLKLELEPEKLVEVLERVVEKIEHTRSRNDKISIMETNYRANLSVLKERFLLDLAFGRFTDQQIIEDKMRVLEIPLAETQLMMMIVQIENEADYGIDSDQSLDLLQTSIKNALQDFMVNVGTAFVFNVREYSFGIIFQTDKLPRATEKEKFKNRLIHSIKELLMNLMNLSAAVGTSDFFDGYLSAPLGYKTAYDALQADLSKGSAILSSIPMEEELVELEGYYKWLDIPGINRVLSGIIEKITTRKDLSHKHLNGICHTLIFLTNTFAQNNNLMVDHLWGENTNPYTEVDKLKKIEEYTIWLEKLKANILMQLNSDNDSSLLIIKAKQYIKKNFNQDITLQIVAESIGLSTGYFSRLFSKETGVSFSDYLTNLRIQTAKELLYTTNDKIYEISERVGYSNPYYFSRLFKKVTGKTPFEFKSDLGR